MTSVTIGARKLTVGDVVAVAVHQEALELDAATLAKSGAGKGKGSTKERDSGNEMTADGSPEQEGCGAAGQKLQPNVARAAIVARISSYMLGRAGVSEGVITQLAQMLSAKTVPVLPAAPGQEGAILHEALLGAGRCYKQGGEAPLIQELEAAGLSPMPSLLAPEAQTIKLGSYQSLGAAAIQAGASLNGAVTADAVAALTCEALQAFSEPFGSFHFDICRQQRGQMTVAENLRLLLSGSKQVDARKNKAEGKLQDPEAIRDIPQIHGPALEAVQGAVKSLEIELNSSEAGPLSRAAGCAGPFHPQQVNSAEMVLLDAVAVLQQASSARVALLKGSEADKANTSASTTKFQRSSEAVQALQESLQTELTLAMGVLDKVQQEAEEKAKQKEAKAAQHAGANGGQGRHEDAMAGMSEAQRAKALAKKKAKEAKAAKKSGGGFGIGTGTMAIRNHLKALEGGAAAACDLSCPRFSKFVAELLEKLASGGVARKPKIAKGARDMGPDQMRVREQAFTLIRRVFKRHAAVEIDTPVFELKSTLTGKYGEDQKLIYDLEDQGGELLALRYDLTVPFARYLALNSVGNIKRFHIGKVYRRDQPNANQGRFREFYQCDFDVAGSYGPMVPDAEVLSVCCEILNQLPIGDFQVKLNHRMLLDAILDICGCPAEKFRMICSAIDKLDKMPWEEVKKEMVEEKGLKPEVADRIGTFVVFSGPPMQLWKQLNDEKKFGAHEGAAKAMADLALLFGYLEAMDTLKFISLDLSLARGLTYYTGLIYEAVILDGTTKVGSIAAGGRYDGLVGMFSSTDTPCVGVSIGIERVFAIVEARAKKKAMPAAVQVYVATIGSGLLVQRMQLTRTLWAADISAEFSSAENPKLKPQLTEALERELPFMVIMGEEEAKAGVVKLKDLGARTEETVARDDLVQTLLAKGCKTVSSAELDLLTA